MAQLSKVIAQNRQTLKMLSSTAKIWRKKLYSRKASQPDPLLSAVIPAATKSR
jgi:hypothetical protein